MITRTSVADEIDVLDAEIAELQAKKAKIYRKWRTHLQIAGVADVPAEIAALKDELKRRHPEPSSHERPPANSFQKPRLAPLAETKAAYRSGHPISGDQRYQNASVYFAQCRSLELLKIGISNDVEARLSDLQESTGLPLTLLRTLPGTRQEELRALEAFRAWHLRGEWYDLTPECRAFVDRYIAEQAA